MLHDVPITSMGERSFAGMVFMHLLDRSARLLLDNKLDGIRRFLAAMEARSMVNEGKWWETGRRQALILFLSPRDSPASI